MSTIQVSFTAEELEDLSDTLWRRKADQFVSEKSLQFLRDKVDKAIVDLDGVTAIRTTMIDGVEHVVSNEDAYWKSIEKEIANETK